jgi:hypothetical protein
MAPRSHAASVTNVKIIAAAMFLAAAPSLLNPVSIMHNSRPAHEARKTVDVSRSGDNHSCIVATVSLADAGSPRIVALITLPLAAKASYDRSSRNAFHQICFSRLFLSLPYGKRTVQKCNHQQPALD